MSESERIRAIEILVELFDGIDANEAQSLANNSPAPVAARATWALGRKPIKEGYDALVELCANKTPLVQRAAYEALIGYERKSDTTLTMPDRSDRRVYTLASMWQNRPGYNGNPVTAKALTRILDDAQDNPPVTPQEIRKCSMSHLRYSRSIFSTTIFPAKTTMSIKSWPGHWACLAPNAPGCSNE